MNVFLSQVHLGKQANVLDNRLLSLLNENYYVILDEVNPVFEPGKGCSYSNLEIWLTTENPEEEGGLCCFENGTTNSVPNYLIPSCPLSK